MKAAVASQLNQPYLLGVYLWLLDEACPMDQDLEGVVLVVVLEEVLAVVAADYPVLMVPSQRLKEAAVAGSQPC